MMIMKKARAPSFQVMPDLNEEEYAVLRDDIARHGVMVPIVEDQHGRILDGHHRDRIATELGIDAPREVRQVARGNPAHLRFGVHEPSRATGKKFQRFGAGKA